MKIVDAGKSNRKTAVTNMNEHSSRSFSVFVINIEQENMQTQKKLCGNLYLVDLAGSEKISKTGAAGLTLEEAKNINKSLSALGNVISALADGSQHVPYRDSRLTRILQESLGGNSRTTLIICCSPAPCNEAETKSTLMFGQRAKRIKNKVTINEEIGVVEWSKKFEKEKEKLGRLAGIIEILEIELTKWRAGKTVPANERAGMLKVSLEHLKIQRPDGGCVSNEEKLLWLEEKKKLLDELDDKDDEISNLTQTFENLKNQFFEQTSLTYLIKTERDQMVYEVQMVQNKIEVAQDEIKEVLRTLEELAVNYDQKSLEIVSRNKENDSLSDDLRNKVFELHEEGENNRNQRKRVIDLMRDLKKDLASICITMGIESQLDIQKLQSGITMEKIEEDFIIAQFYINKMKSEETLMSKCEGNNKILAEVRNELTLCSNVLKQYEEKLILCVEKLKKVRSRNDELQKQVDHLTEESVIYKARGQTYMSELDKEVSEIVANQMNQHKEQHLKQLTELRNDISQKQELIDQLNEKSTVLMLSNEQLKAANIKFKEEDSEKSAKLIDLSLQLNVRKQAELDLKGLQETAVEELQTVHDLRKLFVQDFAERIEKSKVIKADDISQMNCKTQKQQILFLENSLDQLTKVHQEFVHDNADLRYEYPKLEMRHKTTLERIKALEQAYKETKEKSMNDRISYQMEIDRMKEAEEIRQTNLMIRSQFSHIAKGIKTGQRPKN